jgi:hypothetical protein
MHCVDEISALKMAQELITVLKDYFLAVELANMSVCTNMVNTNAFFPARCNLFTHIM